MGLTTSPDFPEMSSVSATLPQSTRATSVRVACALFLASLVGCSSFDNVLSSSKVDYRSSSRQTSGLDVPPDLTQLARDGRAQVQGGVVSASSMQQTGAAVAAAPVMAGNVAPNKAGDVSLERSGDTRWLKTSLTPEQLWPQLQSFWAERGLTVILDQPKIGVMETDWAENRAKIPQDGLRKMIGSVLDSLYSTGERDKFRTRVERTAHGSEIFISHKGMQEVAVSTAKDDFRWTVRPTDPLLEAEMLSRLMIKLGGKEEVANAIVAQTKPAPTTTSTAAALNETRDLSNVPTSLTVNDGFDRAWRRVSQSLDRNGFTIEDRDRVQGLFFLRYADPTKAGKEEPGFFAKLFGTTNVDTTAGRYRVSVKSVGEVSTVQVLDDKGAVQTNDIAKRIISMMMSDLR